MRNAGPVALQLLVLGALGLTGCGETKLDADRSTATTVTKAGVRRFWAIAADGSLTSVLPNAADAETVDWSIEPAAGSTSGVAGLSWDDVLGHHERAYFLANGWLTARSIDEDGPAMSRMG
jgi:hypothetical protein